MLNLPDNEQIYIYLLQTNFYAEAIIICIRSIGQRATLPVVHFPRGSYHRVYPDTVTRSEVLT